MPPEPIDILATTSAAFADAARAHGVAAREALGVYEAEVGPEHPTVAQIVENLGGLDLTQGRYAEAEPLFARALAIKERSFGANSPELIATLQTYALVLRYQDREAEADALDARADAIIDRTGGGGQ